MSNRPLSARWRFSAALLSSLLCLLLTSGGISGKSASTQADECNPYPSPHLRFGVNVAQEGGKSIDDYGVAPLNLGWYLNYQIDSASPHAETTDFAHMVRVGLYRSDSYTQTLTAAVKANRGALWIVGNEPDRDLQDGATPEEYARFYYDTYRLLKMHDATSKVAIAGVVQPTPLRLRYLEQILQEYQVRFGARMPIDVWTVHGFILREESASWGAGIPPALEGFAAEGKLYEIDDHDDIEIFQQQIRTFRRWMTQNGYRNTPLIVSEYGILMPSAYGFNHETVRNFMLSSFDFFLTATDAESGYPADDNRLVQRWSWFSLNFPAYNFDTGIGFNGHLFEHQSGSLLPLGEDFANYVTPRVKQSVDLELLSFQIEPSAIDGFAQNGALVPITFRATMRNSGAIAVQNIVANLWRGYPAAGGQLLTSTPINATLRPGCSEVEALTVNWDTTDISLGSHVFTLVLSTADAQLEKDLSNNHRSGELLVTAESLREAVYLPIIHY